MYRTIKTVNAALLLIGLASVLFACKAHRNQRSKELSNRTHEEMNRTLVHNKRPESITREGLANFNKAVRLNNRNASAYNGRGYCYHILQEYDKALTEYYKAIALDSNYANVYQGIGLVWQAKKKWQKAQYYYRKAISLDSNNAGYYYNMGCSYDDMNELEQAHTFYTACLKKDSNYTYALHNRGNINIQLGYNNLAVVDFTKAIALDSAYFPLFMGRGIAYTRLGLFAKAMADFDKVKQLHPPSPVDTWLLNNIANCYFAMGDKGQACYYWHEAIRMGYIFQAVWKTTWKLEDPNELRKRHCP